MQSTSVIFLKDWIPLVKLLPEKQQLLFWDLFVNYDVDSNIDCEDLIVLPIWTFIKSQLDKFSLKRNSVSANSIENGKKGGRPKNNPEKPRKPSGLFINPENPVGLNKPSETLNSNSNEKVKVNSKDKKETEIFFYSKFYDNEIVNSHDKPLSDKYKVFVDYLFNSNPNKTPYRILKFKHQLTFEQFCELKKMETQTVSLKSKIDALENSGNKYESLYLTLNNWMKNEK